MDNTHKNNITKTASADMSKGTVVKLDSSDSSKISACAATDANAIGVVLDSVKGGDNVAVALFGVANHTVEALAGGAISAGEKVCLAANGMDEQAARDMTALYGTNPGKILDIAVNEERKKIYEIADVIYNAVLCGNEYDGAAAFAQCEKRKTFFAVTAVLYERLSLLLLECKNGKNHNCNIPLERLYGACEILSEYGRLQSTNLNLRLAQTVCCAELFAGLV